MYRCPACTHTLTEKLVGEVVLEVCEGGCGGIWFDMLELKKFEKPGGVDPAPLLSITRKESSELRPGETRVCPKCKENVTLTVRHYGAENKVEVDQCSGCWGVWLDAGELETICKLSRGYPETSANPEADAALNAALGEALAGIAQCGEKRRIKQEEALEDLRRTVTDKDWIE